MKQEQGQGMKSVHTTGKPMMVDVFAKDGCDGLEFTHEWRLEGTPDKRPGPIEVPEKNGETPMHFHLHDQTGLNLRFVNTAADAMWVKRDECPRQTSTDPQITYDKDPTAKHLKVDNLNSEECTLHFALNFDSDQGPKCYDPEIKNGVRTLDDE